MSEDLHLSDLSSGLTHTVAELSMRERSLNNVMLSYSPKLRQINDRSLRLKEYASHLCSVKSKLDAELNKFETDMKFSQSKVHEDEEDLMTRVSEIQMKQTQLKTRREQTDKSVAHEKRSILDLETEATRIAKKDEWAESVLSCTQDFQNRENIRSEILALHGSILDINSEIRLARARVFEQQKVLHDLSDTLAPFRIRKFTLLERLEDAKQNPDLTEVSESLGALMMETKAVAISQQKLAIQKMKIEQNMARIRGEIESARREKAELMQRLAPLRVRDDSLIGKIELQTEQYRANTERYRNMARKAAASKEDFISKELDAKLEHDSISRDLKTVRAEKRALAAVVDKQMKQIEDIRIWLKENIATNEEAPSDVTYESVLADTISQIKQKREESSILEMSSSVIESSSLIEIDEEQFDGFRNRMDSRARKLSNAIKTTKSENLALSETIKSLRQTISEQRSELCELETSLSEVKSRKTPVIIPETPKIRRENAKIEELEASISEIEEKKARITQRKSELLSLSEKIKNNSGMEFLGADILSRIDRAVKWMLAQIAKYRNMNIKLINEWETKVIGAALNEAEELVMRAAPLRM